MPYKEDLASVYAKLIRLLGDPIEEKNEELNEDQLLVLIEKQFSVLQSEFVSYKDQLEESSIMMETQIEEISKTYEEISTLYEVTALLSKTLNPADVLEKLIELILNSVPSLYIGIYLNFGNYTVFKTKQKKAEISEKSSTRIMEYYKSIVDLKQVKVMIIEEEGIRSRFPDFIGIFSSLIIVPLGTEKKMWGVLALGNKENGDLFTAGDRKLLESISNQIYFGLENYQFLQEKIKQERFFEQLEIAKKIQESLLPQKIPEFRELEICCHFEPAIEVAGDYYDIVQLKNKLFLIIADVSGKGVPASLLMSSFRSAVRIFLEVTQELPQIVSKVNNHIAQNEIADRFVTAFCVLLDVAEGKLKYVNAGHDPLILYRPREDRFFEISNEGIPTGIFEGEVYEEDEFTTEPGDVWLLYTDGIPEARNDLKQEFGFERMKEVIKKNHQKTAKEIKAKLSESLKEFVQGAPQHDDITFIILKYKGKYFN